MQKEHQNKFWKREKLRALDLKHLFVLSQIKKGKVLDLGCGDGKILEILKKRGMVVKGVDISEEAVKICKTKKLEVINFDFSSNALPFKNNEFDYVVLSDVLEHLFDPLFVLKESQRVTLKYVIITVPNFNTLFQRIQVLMGKIPKLNNERKAHCFWFNYKELKKMIKKSNLEIKLIGASGYMIKFPILNKIFRLLEWIWPSLFNTSFNILLEKKIE